CASCHRCVKSLILSLILLPCGHSENHMACLRASYAVCVLLLFVFLASHSFGQTPPLLRVDEQQIKFRLDSHPVLELHIVKNKNKPRGGDISPELRHQKKKVDSFETGKFEEKPGTTVEKVE